MPVVIIAVDGKREILERSLEAFRVVNRLAQQGVCVWSMVLLTPTIVARPAESDGNPRSNIVAFIRGEMPILKLEMELDQKIFTREGFTPNRPLILEAGQQNHSFFVKRSWDVVSNSLVVLDHATVWGWNAEAQWIVSGDSVHLSIMPATPPTAEDPVRREVGVFTGFAKIGLRLGFPPNIVVKGLVGESLWMETPEGESVIARVIMSETGRLEGFEYGITNPLIKAVVSIRYEYSPGERPDWLPASVTVSARELMSNGRMFSYADTHRILQCELGVLEIEKGFSPEMFLQGRPVQRSLIWSNGAGIQIEGTNISRILPPDAPSAARPFSDERRWIRIVVIMSILSITTVRILVVENQLVANFAIWILRWVFAKHLMQRLF